MSKKCKNCNETEEYCNCTDGGDFVLSAVVAAATDSSILGAIVGGDITGAVLGDILDGDLFD